MPTDLEIQLTNAHLQVKQARERLRQAHQMIVEGQPDQPDSIALMGMINAASILQAQILEAISETKATEDDPR